MRMRLISVRFVAVCSKERSVSSLARLTVWPKKRFSSSSGVLSLTLSPHYLWYGVPELAVNASALLSFISVRVLLVL